MLSEEKIEKAKEDLMFFNEGDWITKDMDKSADVLEEYIKQLEFQIQTQGIEHNYDVKMIDEVKGEAVKLYKEIDKLNKMIDKMCEELAGLTIWDIQKDEPLILKDKEEVKQYFEREINEDNG